MNLKRSIKAKMCTLLIMLIFCTSKIGAIFIDLHITKNNQYIKLIPIEYQDICLKLQFKYQIPVKYMYIVPEIESSWRKDAISSKGCIGLMQLNPKYEEWFVDMFWLYNDVEFDIYNPLHNLEVGFAYFAWLGSKTDSWSDAIIAYNAGLTTLNRINKGEINTPKESLNYLVKVDRLTRKIES